MTEQPRSDIAKPAPVFGLGVGALKAATPVMLAAAALTLAACGQHAYPGSSEPPPPPPPRPDLMGAPDGPPPAPPQAYAPAQPGLDAPPQPTVQGPYGGQPDAYAQHGYPPGQCPPRAERLPSDGCMDPIPNPPEDRFEHRRYSHRRSREALTSGPYASYAPRRRVHHVYGYAPVTSHRTHGLYRYEPYHPAHHTHVVPVPVPVKPAHAAAKPAARAVAPVAAKPIVKKAVKPVTKTSAHTKAGKTATPSLKAQVAADKAGEATGPAAAMAAALVPLVKSRATLKADGLKPGQPGDVTLTLPPDFADGLRAQAKNNGLEDAAASANLTATLSGDGYVVTPSEPQSLPLTAGQATTFKWTVTPQAGAKGPLHAEVGADLLGGGVQHVDLGAVEQAVSAPKLSSKVVGLTLLVIIALVLAALFAGRRRTAVAVRPRNGGAPPLDLDGDRRV